MAISVLTKKGSFQEIRPTKINDKMIYEIHHNLKGENPIRISHPSKKANREDYEFSVIADWDDFINLPEDIQKIVFTTLLANFPK